MNITQQLSRNWNEQVEKLNSVQAPFNLSDFISLALKKGNTSEVIAKLILNQYGLSDYIKINDLLRFYEYTHIRQIHEKEVEKIIKNIESIRKHLLSPTHSSQEFFLSKKIRAALMLSPYFMIDAHLMTLREIPTGEVLATQGGFLKRIKIQLQNESNDIEQLYAFLGPVCNKVIRFTSEEKQNFERTLLRRAVYRDQKLANNWIMAIKEWESQGNEQIRKIAQLFLKFLISHRLLEYERRISASATFDRQALSIAQEEGLAYFIAAQTLKKILLTLYPQASEDTITTFIDNYQKLCLKDESQRQTLSFYCAYCMEMYQNQKQNLSHWQKTENKFNNLVSFFDQCWTVASQIFTDGHFNHAYHLGTSLLIWLHLKSIHQLKAERENFSKSSLFQNECKIVMDPFDIWEDGFESVEGFAILNKIYALSIEQRKELKNFLNQTYQRETFLMPIRDSAEQELAYDRRCLMEKDQWRLENFLMEYTPDTFSYLCLIAHYLCYRLKLVLQKPLEESKISYSFREHEDALNQIMERLQRNVPAKIKMDFFIHLALTQNSKEKMKQIKDLIDSIDVQCASESYSASTYNKINSLKELEEKSDSTLDHSCKNLINFLILDFFSLENIFKLALNLIFKEKSHKALDFKINQNVSIDFVFFCEILEMLTNIEKEYSILLAVELQEGNSITHLAYRSSPPLDALKIKINLLVNDKKIEEIRRFLFSALLYHHLNYFLINDPQISPEEKLRKFTVCRETKNLETLIQLSIQQLNFLVDIFSYKDLSRDLPLNFLKALDQIPLDKPESFFLLMLTVLEKQNPNLSNAWTNNGIHFNLEPIEDFYDFLCEHRFPLSKNTWKSIDSSILSRSSFSSYQKSMIQIAFTCYHANYTLHTPYHISDAPHTILGQDFLDLPAIIQFIEFLEKRIQTQLSGEMIQSLFCSQFIPVKIHQRICEFYALSDKRKDERLYSEQDQELICELTGFFSEFNLSSFRAKMANKFYCDLQAWLINSTRLMGGFDHYCPFFSKLDHQNSEIKKLHDFATIHQYHLTERIPNQRLFQIETKEDGEQLTLTLRWMSSWKQLNTLKLEETLKLSSQDTQEIATFLQNHESEFKAFLDPNPINLYELIKMICLYVSDDQILQLESLPVFKQKDNLIEFFTTVHKKFADLVYHLSQPFSEEIVAEENKMNVAKRGNVSTLKDHTGLSLLSPTSFNDYGFNVLFVEQTTVSEILFNQLDRSFIELSTWIELKESIAHFKTKVSIQISKEEGQCLCEENNYEDEKQYEALLLTVQLVDFPQITANVKYISRFLKTKEETLHHLCWLLCILKEKYYNYYF